MKRKIVSCILVASLSLSFGCYSNKTITKDELKARTERVDITVYTVDSLKYEFATYSLQGDTLSGHGMQRNPTTSAFESFAAAIPCSNITSIEAEEFSIVKTIVFSALVGLVGVLIIGSVATKQQPSGGLGLPALGR